MATRTKSFGVGKREAHDASAFYARGLASIVESKARNVNAAATVDEIFEQSSEQMTQLPDDCVALMVTSPPYHVGNTYDADTSFEQYLDLLHRSSLRHTVFCNPADGRLSTSRTWVEGLTCPIPPRD